MVTLSDEAGEALSALMREDLQRNRTAYLAGLIGAEKKRREKKPVGRPRKVDDETEEVEEVIDYSDDLPKAPYFGEMIGPREYADRERAKLEALAEAQRV